MNITQIAESLQTAFDAKNLEVIITKYDWAVRIEAPTRDVRVNVGSVRCGPEQLPQLVIWDNSFNLVNARKEYDEVLRIWAYLHSIKLTDYGE